MITEHDWERSHGKWFDIVAYLAKVLKTPPKERDHTQIQSDLYDLEEVFCAYCEQFNSLCETERWKDSWGNEVYKDCPLRRVHACYNWGNTGEGMESRYWKYRDAVNENRYHHAHGHAVVLLQAIEDTKEEVTGRSMNDYLRSNGRTD